MNTKRPAYGTAGPPAPERPRAACPPDRLLSRRRPMAYDPSTTPAFFAPRRTDFALGPGWGFPVPILEGEMLSSWLCRSAHLHGAGCYAFLSLRLPGEAIWDRDLDVGTSYQVVERLGRLSGIPEERILDATLQPWARPAAGGDEAGRSRPARIPFLLAAGVFGRSRRRHGLQYCPACLREGVPYFRRGWRLASSVACPRHGVALRDGCPRCDAPVAPHRAGIGEVASCHACGTCLSGGRPTPPHPGLALAASVQARCGSALSSPEATDADLRCRGADALDLVRTLASASAPAPVHAALRNALSCPGEPPGPGRRQLELMRAVDRVAALQVVGALMEDWPARFHAAAGQAGLTRRSFERLSRPPILEAALGGLEPGAPRERPRWRSILDGADMRRLKRRDPSAYRLARCRRILAQAAVPVEREGRP